MASLTDDNAEDENLAKRNKKLIRGSHTSRWMEFTAMAAVLKKRNRIPHPIAVNKSEPLKIHVIMV